MNYMIETCDNYCMRSCTMYMWLGLGNWCNLHFIILENVDFKYSSHQDSSVLDSSHLELSQELY